MTLSEEILMQILTFFLEYLIVHPVDKNKKLYTNNLSCFTKTKLLITARQLLRQVGLISSAS
jgi:hypothetical protein